MKNVKLGGMSDTGSHAVEARKVPMALIFVIILYMGVSKNSGTSKSSIFIWFSIINHPFWGNPIFGNTHIGTHMTIKTSAPKRPKF